MYIIHKLTKYLFNFASSAEAINNNTIILIIIIKESGENKRDTKITKELGTWHVGIICGG